MLKDSSYQIKFSLLQPWFKEIIQSVKKELKQDHIAKDRVFQKKYLQGKSFLKASIQELTDAYQNAINAGEEAIADIVATRWILKNSDLYTFFVENLQKINTQFNEIEKLTQEQAEKLFDESKKLFDSAKVYTFSLLNAVSFDDNFFEKMREEALKTKPQEPETSNEIKDVSLQDMQKIIDKYEKKISGLQKKYHQDVETLKKQISNLHRKLSSKV